MSISMFFLFSFLHHTLRKNDVFKVFFFTFLLPFTIRGTNSVTQFFCNILGKKCVFLQYVGHIDFKIYTYILRGVFEIAKNENYLFTPHWRAFMHKDESCHRGLINLT